MTNPTALEIVEQWLRENDYDGLYTDGSGGGCSCTLDDLAPCSGGWFINCRAGYKQPCKYEGGLSIGPTKAGEPPEVL